MVDIKTPIKIGTKTLPNRITFAPTVKFDWTDRSGIAIERFAQHYEARAKGGAGLICVEATCIHPEGRLAPSQLGLWEDAQIDGHRAIVEACKRHGAVIIVQIHHGGYNTHPDCGPSKGPSVVEWRGRTTEEMSIDEIHQARDQFIEASIRAQKAGYDGIQLHACHSYLLDQFFSPVVNLRADEYGGSTENRTRLACEVIRGIREACGDDFLISARVPGAEPTLEEAHKIADFLIEAGVDYLQVSNGIGPDESKTPEGLPFNHIVWIGTQMPAYVNGRVPVSVVNGLDRPELARYIIATNLADTIDSARALLADPEWARAVTDGTDYVKCIRCKRCFWSPMMEHKCPAVMERRKTDPTCVD